MEREDVKSFCKSRSSISVAWSWTNHIKPIVGSGWIRKAWCGDDHLRRSISNSENPQVDVIMMYVCGNWQLKMVMENILTKLAFLFRLLFGILSSIHRHASFLFLIKEATKYQSDENHLEEI